VKQTLFSLTRATPVRACIALVPVAVRLDDHFEVGLGWRTSVEQGVYKEKIDINCFLVNSGDALRAMGSTSARRQVLRGGAGCSAPMSKRALAQIMDRCAGFYCGEPRPSSS
jgi:hypothetical protein